jgi:hypothetical protein
MPIQEILFHAARATIFVMRDGSYYVAKKKSRLSKR